ncbi:MAG: efflux RND transporter periplasmic adaptor subunit [Deltaproteobacteria bacterium]|nr:efflux RND transporter periplasmic adaptor subunit [Deltaproteobacteria bacterium]
MRKINIKDLGNKIKSIGLKKTLVLTAGVIVLIIIISIIIPKNINIATATAVQGEFIIDLNTTGELDAFNSTNVSVPRLRKRMTLQIIDMVPEGTYVKKGDFLIQLDNSEAIQKVEEAKDRLENARAQLESEKASIESNMAQLKSQLETQRYNYDQAKLRLKMMQFEAEARKQDAELSMKKAKAAMDQAEQRIESQKIIDNATLMKAELSVKQAEADLKEAQQALEKLTIKSPINGLVVYKEIYSASGMKKVQIGDTPWPGFPVIGIPDLSVMQAKTTVNETDINKIKTGLNAVVTVDALEGKAYYGKITRVASLARREYSTNTKVFDVEITLDSTDKQLRPGMTCSCQIIVDRLKDVTYIPIQAVFEKEGKTVVYVKTRRGVSQRPVVVGKKSSNFIQIKEGLKAGEQVCLRDPTIPLDEIGGESEQNSAAPVKKKKSSGSKTFQIKIG